MSEKNTTIAIVLAAGQGKRMNSKTAKQYLLLSGKPVLYYSLKAFQDSCIDHIILVTGEADKEYVQREIVEKYELTKVCCIVEGGKERYHSVYNGLLAAEAYCKGEGYVFIHDGARPFVNDAMIEKAFQCVQNELACVVGMPVKDTIKIADEEGYAANTPKRSLLWMVQTPQVFAMPLISGAYKTLIEKESELLGKGVLVTDDASVVELFTDKKVKLVEGSYENIKITTPEDLSIAEVFLNALQLKNADKMGVSGTLINF